MKTEYLVYPPYAAVPGYGGNWASCLLSQVKSAGTRGHCMAVKDAYPELINRRD